MGDRQTVRPSHDTLPVDARGVVGNMKTTALISLHGAVDFMCYPRIDSPTIFAALLDSERGGFFEIRPVCDEFNVKQMYIPETNVLLTRFMTPDGVCELLDLMPVNTAETDGEDALPNCLVRIVRMAHGKMPLRMRCAPRFDYARTGHTACLTTNDSTVEFAPESADSASQPRLQLQASVPLGIADGCAEASFQLQKGHEAESVCFVFGAVDELHERLLDCEALYNDTTHFWQSWASQSTYRGRYREVVMRSALTLKLLSSREHGAIVAAPTFGLPETLDGSRRWDYRFAWIRDAAFSVYALLRLGYTSEARHFIKWISERNRRCDSDGSLRVMYAVDGTPAPDEIEIDTLAGDHQGVPLVGNGAHDQVQFDVYGALLDALYLYNKYGAGVSYDGWRHITRTVNYVVEHWREPDHGIWELRNGARPLLHSRLMCWVTVDRALRLADKRSLPAPFENWFATRDEIHRDIHEHFWNQELQSFVQTPGSSALDASALMMPLVRFIGPADPRFLGTLDAIGRDLRVDPLIFRYTRGSELDGLQGIEGGFSACSFWYAEALARAGRVDEGRLVFDKMLEYANHLGLFSEEVATTGEALGNFPQALTHLALISAAYQLDRSLDKVHVPWT